MPTLVVQLGHCYRKTGATGTAGEQEFATRVGAACAALLHGRGGWQVRQVLADVIASAYRGDAFVAVHCDGSLSASARGASIGYRTPEGQQFGQAWKRAYAARGWTGFRLDNYTAALAGYYGTGTAVAQGNRRAVIVECGFLTNPEDRALLTGVGGAERVALAIGDALGIPTGQPPQEDDTVSWNDPLTFTDPETGRTATYPASVWLMWTNHYANQVPVLQSAVAEIRDWLKHALWMDGQGDDAWPLLRSIGNIRAQLCGDVDGDGLAPPDVYDGWDHLPGPLDPELHPRLTMLDFVRSAHAWQVRMAASVAAMRAKVDQISVGGVDYAELARHLADEQDRRARDADPTTGPTT